MDWLIPPDERGYAVEPSGLVHRRHARHAENVRRTTLNGLLNMGLPLHPCRECFPPPRPVRRVRVEVERPAPPPEVGE